MHHRWIWEQGGGYFGVPLTNYLGWFFTVYVFFQLFALSLRWRRTSSDGEVAAFPRSYDAQALIMYAVIGLAVVVEYLGGAGNALVTNAAEVFWGTSDKPLAQAGNSIVALLFV